MAIVSAAQHPPDSREAKIARVAASYISDSSDVIARVYDRARRVFDLVAAPASAYDSSSEKFFDDDTKKVRDKEGRPSLVMNRMHPRIQALVGRETLNRFRAQFTPRTKHRSGEEAEADIVDRAVADWYDAVYSWVRDQTHSEQIETLAALSMFACGYGFVTTSWDEDAGPDGRGRVRDRFLNLFDVAWDISAVMPGLLDARWWAIKRGLQRDHFLDLYEGVAGRGNQPAQRVIDNVKASIVDNEVPSSLVATPSSTGPRTAWHNFLDHRFFPSESRYDTVYVQEFEWREWQTDWKVRWTLSAVDLQRMAQEPGNASITLATGQVITQTELLQMGERAQTLLGREAERAFPKKADAVTFIEEQNQVNPQAPILTLPQRDRRPYVSWAHLVGSAVMTHGRRRLGFSHGGLTAFPWIRDSHVEFYGVGDLLVDPTTWGTIFANSMLHNVGTGAKDKILLNKSKWPDKQEREDLKDEIVSAAGVGEAPQEFFEEDGHIRIEPGGFIREPSALMEMVDRNADSVLGLDPISANLQSDLRRVSGRVAEAANAASQGSLSFPFDALRLYRKNHAVRALRILRRNVTEEWLREIAPPQAGVEADWRRLLEDLRSNVEVEEAPYSATELQRLWESLFDSPIPEAIITHFGIDGLRFIIRHMPALDASSRADFERMAEAAGTLESQQEQIEQLLQGVAQLQGGAELLQQLGLQPQEVAADA